MTNKPYKQTPIAADVVSRLPIFQQLNASQSELLKLAPAWSAWCREHLPFASVANVQLSSLTEQKLVIACSNATLASQLKHQQTNLLDSLNDSRSGKGAEIEQIVIRLQHASAEHQKTTQTRPETRPMKRKTPSENALKAIDNCQKMVANDALAKSLNRLRRTLRESNKKG